MTLNNGVAGARDLNRGTITNSDRGKGEGKQAGRKFIFEDM
jgi:hypothetical protein